MPSHLGIEHAASARVGTVRQVHQWARAEHGFADSLGMRQHELGHVPEAVNLDLNRFAATIHCSSVRR
ncbi:hypothetical protein, partial [Klebsiella pneumoniae]|uniref:hypothetical protein n=1 Tax=Klebsiella pneumoniae TaxID=573 RepID=UPI003A83D3D9